MIDGLVRRLGLGLLSFLSLPSHVLFYFFPGNWTCCSSQIQTAYIPQYIQMRHCSWFSDGQQFRAAQVRWCLSSSKQASKTVTNKAVIQVFHSHAWQTEWSRWQLSPAMINFGLGMCQVSFTLCADFSKYPASTLSLLGLVPIFAMPKSRHANRIWHQLVYD